MLKLSQRRAALLAGLSAAVLVGVSASDARAVTWGASKTDTAASETGKRAKKAKSEARTEARTEAKREQVASTRPLGWFSAPATTDGSGRSATISPADPEAVGTRSKKNKAAKNRKNRTGVAAKAEPAAPVIPNGPLHIIVSVDAQRATLYANGTYVASTKVSTGTKTHPTPMGVFSVIQKNKHHISNLYYASMPYMQRLTWSGTAMHTGPLPGYPASHGCVRLTNDFAQLLWKATKLGARVIVTREEVKPVEIAHDRLVPPPAPVPEPVVAQPAAAPAPETTGALIRTADATNAALSTDAASKLEIAAPAPIINDKSIIKQNVKTTARDIGKSSAKEAASGPISIFISRKDSRLYVRQAMQPLFDLPLTLRDPNQPLGTHVYTAMEMKDGVMRWTAVSIPSAFPRQAVKVEKTVKGKKRTRVEPAIVVEGPAPSASEALDRIDLPQEALKRLAGMVTPGSSLIVSDNGIGHETGKSTDFIVLTR